MPPAATRPGDILAFWFSGHARERWFATDAAFDADICRRFASVCRESERGRLDGWAATPEGALALVIVLDQFPRNMHRGEARAFLHDALALAHADRAVAAGHHRAVATPERRFFYLPFMHNERLADQDRCVALLAEDGDDPIGLDFAEKHRAVIRRFGRFPHRNAILGRTSTAEEEAFLTEPNSSF